MIRSPFSSSCGPSTVHENPFFPLKMFTPRSSTDAMLITHRKSCRSRVSSRISQGNIVVILLTTSLRNTGVLAGRRAAAVHVAPALAAVLAGPAADAFNALGEGSCLLGPEVEGATSWEEAGCDPRTVLEGTAGREEAAALDATSSFRSLHILACSLMIIVLLDGEFE
jgi:hypothetical protein